MKKLSQKAEREIVLEGFKILLDADNHKGAYTLVSGYFQQTGLRGLVTEAIEICLARLAQSKKHFFSRILPLDDLTVACDLVASGGASTAAAEKVLTHIAQNGWCGRAEVFAIKYVLRPLKPSEVRALVDSYIKDKSTQGDSTEQELNRLARRYMSTAEANKVEADLAAFREEFYSHMD